MQNARHKLSSFVCLTLDKRKAESGWPHAIKMMHMQLHFEGGGRALTGNRFSSQGMARDALRQLGVAGLAALLQEVLEQAILHGQRLEDPLDILLDDRFVGIVQGEVASSKMINWGDCSMTRARASRCRCPPLKLLPFSEMSPSKPPRLSRISSRMQAFLAASRSSSLVTVCSHP
jgi:hypothetical protein